MAKIKKHPKFNFNKIKDFEKIVPDKDIDETLDDEFVDLYQQLKKPKNKIGKDLKKYFVIKLVTTVESHLKWLVAHLIDEHDVKINKLFPEGIVSLSLNDLGNIRKKAFSIGKMSAVSFDFHRKEETNQVLSSLLGIHFLNSLIEYGEIASKNKVVGKVDVEHFKSNEKEFFKMFSLRHKIVHTMQTPKELSNDSEYFYTIWDTSYHFLKLVFSMAESMMDFKEKTLKEKELKIFFTEKIKEYKNDRNIK